VISVEHGIVTIKDLRREREYQFQSVDLSLHHFDVQKPFAVTAAFDNTQEYWNGKVHSRVSAKGSVSLAGLKLEEASIRADEIALRTGGKTAHAKLTVKSFKHPAIELSVKLPPLNSDFLQQYHRVPPGITAPASYWRARLSFPEEGRLQMDSLTGTAGGLKVQANGSLRLSKEAKPFRLSWNIPASPLHEAAAIWSGLKKYDLSGRAGFSGDLVGDLVDLDHTLAVPQAAVNLQDFGGVFFRDQRLDQRLSRVDAWLTGNRNFETLSVAATR